MDGAVVWPKDSKNGFLIVGTSLAQQKSTYF
jgi:hypothetical protein